MPFSSNWGRGAGRRRESAGETIHHADTEGFGRTAWSPSGAWKGSSGVRRGRSHRAADGKLKENHSLHAFFLDRSHESFGKGVQIGRARWQLHGLDSGIGEHAEELLCVERISVVNQIPFLLEDAVFAVG